MFFITFRLVLCPVSVKPGNGEDFVIVADGIISGVDNTKTGSTTFVTGGVIEASGAALQYLERSTLLRRYVGTPYDGDAPTPADVPVSARYVLGPSSLRLSDGSLKQVQTHTSLGFNPAKDTLSLDGYGVRSEAELQVGGSRHSHFSLLLAA